MTHKFEIKGQVIIPKTIRDRVRVLRGTWSKEGITTEALLTERRKERELEERKAEGHGVGRL
jgi:bifunctional DNA-binding transcriptional regulator/antitoxin component of YhaV-PrlF toxin-antitoxin module